MSAVIPRTGGLLLPGLCFQLGENAGLSHAKVPPRARAPFP